MRVRLYFNPAAGRGRARKTAARIVEELRRRGVSVETHESRGAQHLTDLATTAGGDDDDRAVILGGDGTLHHFVRGFPLDKTLAIVPSGSGDDFAKLLGIPHDVRRTCDVLLGDKVRPVDVAVANGTRYLGVAGVGFDSIVARHANGVRFLRGSLVYLWSIFRVLPQFEAKQLRVTLDGQVLDREMMFAVVANGTSYGGGIRIAPAAAPDDGRLELYLTLRCSKTELLKTLPKSYVGKHVSSSFVEHHSGTTIRFEADEKLELYADGEYVTTTPVEITLAPQRLKIRV